MRSLLLLATKAPMLSSYVKLLCEAPMLVFITLPKSTREPYENSYPI